MAILTTAADTHLRSSQTMGLSSQSAFSISCWINGVWNPGSRRSLVGIYGGSADTALAAPITGVQIGTTNGSGELTCWTWGGGVLVGTAAGVMTALNNAWVHIVYTYDSTTHRVYLNGALAASQLNTVNPQIAGFLNQVYINGYPTGTTSEVSAFYIDQYTLFRRTLAPDEIQTMYYSQGARHGLVNGLICKFEFDEGIEGSLTASVPDLSNSGHNLSVDGVSTAISYSYVNSLASSNIRPVQ
jgi:hypothetical protein